MLFAHHIPPLALLFLLICTHVGAQLPLPGNPALHAQEGSYAPKFLINKKMQVPSAASGIMDVQAPVCEGCTFDHQVSNLPRYVVYAPVDEYISVTDFSFSGQYEDHMDTLFERTMAEVGYQHFNQTGSDWYPSAPFDYGQTVVLEGKHYIELIFSPIQVYRDGRIYRQWSRINYNMTSYMPVPLTMLQQPQAGHPSANHKTGSATESVLATGNWYRVAVTNDGVYKLDRGLLSSLGIDVNKLDANTLRVFGYGGGMLPQDNAAARYDDLPELPLYFPGGADGRLDDGEAAYFYAQGPHAWRFMAAPDSFIYEKNLYSDTAYYYINVGTAPGKRMQSQPSAASADRQLDASLQLEALHDDKLNLIQMGRHWMADNFNTRTSYDYTLTAPDALPGTTAKVRVGAAARARALSTMTVSEGGQPLGTVSFGAAQVDLYWGEYAKRGVSTLPLDADRLADGALNLNLTYNKVSDAQAWSDYIELRYSRQLRYSGGVQPVRFVGTGIENVGITLQNTPQDLLIWDVTDPVNPLVQQADVSGGVARCNVPHNTPAAAEHLLLAFTLSAAATPVAAGSVANQNLHGLPQTEYIIVTHPAFWTEAQRLARLHEQQLGHSVLVVTPQQVYNEFSSGRQDVSAIRDFMRMFYTRATTPAERPRYLTLFGDASYDYRGIAQPRPYVPTYLSRESFRPTESFSSDDYFAFLDENEGFWGEGKVPWGDHTNQVQNHSMDISVGRLPVTNIDEARTVVDKIIAYANPTEPGPWQNQVTLVGDYYKTEAYHTEDADDLATSKIGVKSPCMNVEKIYLDNYPEEIRPNGEFYPQAREALLKSLAKGQLVVNYTGHGAEVLLSNSRILEIPDIQALENGTRMPFWITATCDFGRFDDPERRTGAEYLVLQPNGGAIGILTSNREVFSNQNQQLNKAYYDWVFRYDTAESRFLTFGEVYKGTKNQAGGNLNNRCYVMLGDPGLTLALPQNQVVVTAVNNQPHSPTAPDTLKALGRVTLQGEVRNAAGLRLQDFHGQVYVTIFDKPTRYITKQAGFQFDWQHNVLFVGLVPVQKGQFSTEFYVPLDISYEVGRGKISFFATTMNVLPVQTAGGCSQDVVVCCTDPAAVPNTIPPTVDVFLNALNWVSGSTTDPNPTLLVELQDDQGINTTGLGVGREIVAFLNDDFSKPIILNNFYSAKLNKPAAGQISYPFANLPEGRHKLTVRAWDVTNNSATGTTEFIVSSDGTLALAQLLAYPNPMTRQTTFRINHNRAESPLDIVVQITDLSGRLVKEISQTVSNGSNLVTEIQWDGTLDNGAPIAAGLYHFQVRVTETTTGQEAIKAASLVVIK